VIADSIRIIRLGQSSHSLRFSLWVEVQVVEVVAEKKAVARGALIKDNIQQNGHLDVLVLPG
jgi:hypothetical protein